MTMTEREVETKTFETIDARKNNKKVLQLRNENFRSITKKIIEMIQKSDFAIKPKHNFE